MDASTQDSTPDQIPVCFGQSIGHLKERMEARSESPQSVATFSRQRVCYCERPMNVKTAHTSKNFGRRFMGCENWKIHRDCGFFEWVDPKMCAHGQRVVGRLVEWHESLVAETKRCETMVEVEVGKVKAEMEKEIEKVKAEVDNERNAEIAQYRKEIEIWGIKFEAVKKNYHTMLVCSWILFALCFFFGHAAKNQEDNRVGYLRLP